MEDKKNVINKWFEFREEELETNLSQEDKKYSYYFEEHRNVILNCANKELYDLINGELDKLQEDVVKSLMYFNRKYYMAGFIDVAGIIGRIKND